MGGTIPGTVFSPTEEEVFGYLRMKKEGHSLPERFIVESDVYGGPPWQVVKGDRSQWQKFATRGGKIKPTIYVFTQLRKASQNRIRRTAGCGRWHENKTEQILDYSGAVIGFRKLFNFIVVNNSVFEGADEGLRKGHWIMYEYTLKNGDFPWALCKITRDDSKDVKTARNNAPKKKGSDSSEGTNDCRIDELESLNGLESLSWIDCYGNSTEQRLTAEEELEQ